jgi:hypothetical protein
VRINTIFAAACAALDAVAAGQIRDLGPTWGSWRSWTVHDTQNVICHDVNPARKLLRRAMQAVCNFYIPQDLYLPLDRPIGTKFYQGNFSESADDIEDVIAMHLVAPTSDLVLMFGFDLGSAAVSQDALAQHAMRNRLGLIRQCIQNNPQVQWVLIDHTRDLDPAFSDLDNIARDNLSNVLQLLGE